MSEFKRQHPVAAITQLLAIVKQNLVPIIIFGVLGTRNTDGYFLYFFLFGLVSALVLGVLGWFRFTYRVIDDELQINKGILVRKKLFLSKDRIQVIDITEGLIQRMFGLVKVEVKSAGSGTEGATISAITRPEALELRSILRAEKVLDSEADDAEEVVKEQTTIEQSEDVLAVQLSSKHLFYAALTSGNFGLIASILGAISGQIDQLVTKENVEYFFNKIPLLGSANLVVSIIIFILIVSYIFSFVGVIFKYFDFKVEKKSNELHITTGLLERKHTTVPFNRIQSVRFVEGILRQPFGFGMLYVESAGFQSNNADGSIVLFPFIKKSKVEAFFGDFLSDLKEPEKEIQPPSRSMLRYIRRPMYLPVLLLGIIGFKWTPAWYFLSLLPLFAWYGWQKYKDAALHYDTRNLKLEYRRLAKHSVYVKKNRIQSSQATINPFQIRKKLATYTLTVASGAGGKDFSLVDFNNSTCQGLVEWSFPKETQFDDVIED
jgi:putative membrane protein